jgi:hypothetical protein
MMGCLPGWFDLLIIAAPARANRVDDDSLLNAMPAPGSMPRQTGPQRVTTE